MASLFDTLELGAFRAGITARTEESKKWFQANIKKLGQVNRTSLLKDDALDPVTKTVFGNMYMYFYDPKYKEELPYYDRFPLVLMVEPAPGGFYGLNLHYVNPVARARLLNELFKLAPKKLTNDSRLNRLRYDLLQGVKKYKEYEPCFKRYLMTNVQSQMSRVPMTDWETAIYLPIQQFKKKSARSVWADSRKVYQGGK